MVEKKETKETPNVVPVQLGNVYDMLLLTEERSLNKTQQLRNDMVDNYIMEKGLPTSPREMEVFNGILNSTDDQTFKLIKVRQGSEVKEESEDAVALVLEILKGVNVPKPSSTPQVTTIDKQYVPTDVVEGEDTKVYEALSMSDVVGE